eukprot:m.278099 g.278099  ORF g.278099 m.278099 type:complete len:315 (+) comp26939_c0_seq5:82-1026(+)
MIRSCTDSMMVRSTLVPVLALAASVFGQDTTPCESYDLTTGIGACNSINVNIGNVICANGFDANSCKATLASTSGGNSETYFFKGTPTGLPIGTSIQSDCSTGDFPGTGVAMAQTYQDPSGNPAGCYPAADVQGTTLSYSMNGAVLASVTVNFAVHTDSGGTQRDGFIKITCQSGGPTSNFAYTTVGDAGHASQYEIDVVADCSGGGGPPPPPPPPGPAPPGPAPPGPPTTPGGQTGGKSDPETSPTGWILVGCFLFFSVAYFGGGYAYNWKVKGAESGERVPQKEFWVGMPGLIKDGFCFVKAKIKKEEYTPL